MFKRILIPLDGSRISARAVNYGVEVAKPFKAEIVLLQVVKPTTPMFNTTSMMPGAESPTTAQLAVQIAMQEDKRNTSRAKRYLSGKVRQIKERGVQVSYRVLVGDPAPLIKETIRKVKADLVVMTTSGKSGIKRAILGSVADSVVRESGKPVLLIKLK